LIVIDCDGCGAVEKMHRIHERTSMPVTITHQIGDEGGESKTLNRDLCTTCARKLFKSIDPRDWPRDQKEGG